MDEGKHVQPKPSKRRPSRMPRRSRPRKESAPLSQGKLRAIFGALITVAVLLAIIVLVYIFVQYRAKEEEPENNVCDYSRTYLKTVDMYIKGYKMEKVLNRTETKAGKKGPKSKEKKKG